MPDNGNNLNRRQLLKYSAFASAGGLSAFAGCSNNGGSSGSGGSGGSNGSVSIDFASNWKQRRTTSLDEWKLSDRQAVPDANKQGSTDAWKQSKSVKSAPWQPPKGWEDSAAADVDSIQVLNFGSLDYDPATVATYAMFEDRTGIKIDPLELVVDQAIPKETAFLKAERSSPQAFEVVTTSSFSSFADAGYLANLDALMPKDEMWDTYQPVTKPTSTWNNHVYTCPAYLEASLVHVRPDLLKEQGVPENSRKAILDGSWTWDDLEAAMKAFEGTGTYAWAYRGGSRTYTLRDFEKMFYQAGGTFYENGKVKVNTDAGYAAVEKMVEWRNKGWVPNEVVSYGQGDLADGFLSGQFAMVPVYGDLVSKALAKYEKGTEYQPTLSPKGGSSTPNPTRAGIASPTGISINVNASESQKAAAMLFGDALLSESSQWWEFVVEGNQSFSKSVYDEASQAGVAEFADIRGKQMTLNQAEVFPQERPIKQHVSQQVQKAIAGDLDPKKALDQAQSFINTILGQ
ncbi:ABC transporter substrate-binding protein [Halarchaeum acidiphilum]|nr:extracellular solute-binding protein [Halarchaeum acidiphilum]